MGFRLEHGERVGKGLRRVALERLDDAIERLDGLADLDPADTEAAVHAVRKRAKEVRGLVRLVRPHLGSGYRRANGGLRDAAAELASIRDAQALALTFADLRTAMGDNRAHGVALDALQRVLDGRAAAAASAAVAADDQRVVRCRAGFVAVRREVQQWALPKGYGAVAEGLEATYRRGRVSLRAAREDPSDETLHEWRKAVKHLWYQVRLFEPTAPSVLGPLADRLDDLAAALGDDHDLAVLAHLLDGGTDDFGDEAQNRAGIELARQRQTDLRHRGFGLGARVYAEKPKAFVARMEAYWRLDRAIGKEPKAGTIADLAQLGDRPARTVERERKFLVTGPPPVAGTGDHIRQGYFAIDRTVSARVRERSGWASTMTVKAGSGATRTELEWELAPEIFDLLWPLAEGRCIDKTRYEVAVGDHTAEVDVFGGSLGGLCLVEVEFDSDAAMAAFIPPDWFGAEVTDDGRYANAHLATHGLAED